MSRLNVQNFPRPPLLQKISRHVRITYQGQELVDTREAYWVLETHHAPTYYVPPSAVKLDLRPTGRVTGCEWKGAATYWQTEMTDGTTVANRLWSYEAPTEAFAAIRGYLSFYAGGPWACFVDGEQVEPQPGDFYGGWVTSDIDGVVKGNRGTLDPIVR
ncbi:hypothetical protein CDD83_2011 [Cordyceps sp. RAO-2017]|nr:hypothetical protein CDD83_2011 [Cordyceps sp. RAO-2017]